MNYDFDSVIDRRGTKSLKWDFAKEKGKPSGLLPLWIADMDFKAPDCVLAALKERCEHGVFGYSDVDDDYKSAVADWFLRRFNWKVRPEWMCNTPGIVSAVHIAISAFSNEGDGILIQPPVYYPFAEAIELTGRSIVNNELVLRDGKYCVDMEDFERKIVGGKVKVFVLCTPHNPVGRVWSAAELEAMGKVCEKHGVIVIADEIHADFVHSGHKHLPFADLNAGHAKFTITCTAPSKTFNIAGLQMSNIIIADDTLREAFMKKSQSFGFGQPNVMGIIACEAAYRGGEAWLEQLKKYLEGNVTYLREYLANHLPQIKLVEPEGTYLVWLDCRDIGIGEGLDDFIVNDAKLWLDDGAMFGKNGQGFQRVNIACPRATLEKAMEQLRCAVGCIAG